MYIIALNICTSVLVLHCKASVLAFVLEVYSFCCPEISQCKAITANGRFLLKYTDKIKVKRVRIRSSSTDYIRLFYSSVFATQYYVN